MNTLVVADASSLFSLTTPAMHSAPSESAHLAEDTTTTPSDGAHLAETPQVVGDPLAATTGNLFTFYGGEKQANREEQLADTIDAAAEAAGGARLSWPVPLPPVLKPTPLPETTPKAPPPMAPQAPRGMHLGPPPLLTPQSRDIAGSPPASSSEEYEHGTETEDNASTPAPAPSTEENTSPPAPVPSTEENASTPELVPSTGGDEERGDSGDSGCFELVPEPTRPGEATTVLSHVYVKAAEITDISDGP